MTQTPTFQLGQFLKEQRLARGFNRPGLLARWMRPTAPPNTIARLGMRIRSLEDEGLGDSSLFHEMVKALGISPDDLHPRIEAERRLLTERREGEKVLRETVYKVLQATVRYKETLRRLHPWVPVPQSGTCYAFGEQKLPLPVGAIFELWERSPEFASPCPDCHAGTAFGYSFGGLFSIGGISRFCDRCGVPSTNHYGGFGPLLSLVEPLLADTPFFVSGWRFGAAYPGERRPLVEVLRGLGWDAEVSEAWLGKVEESSVGFALRRKGNRGFYFES